MRPYETRDTKSLSRGVLSRMLLVMLVSAGLLGCAQKDESQEDEKQPGHALIGVVKSVNAANNEITVAHEDIPNFMQAMTMVFKVGPGDVKVLAEGDHIRARLVRDEDGAFRLVNVWKIDSKQEEQLRKINKKLAETVEGLDSGYYFGEGDAFPEFALLDQFGKSVTPDQYAGKPFVLNFIFTRCTDAKMCPLSTSKMARLQRMAAEAGLDDLQFVSVTLDPEYDTPGVLRTYQETYRIDGSNFRFVTGDKAAIKRLISSMALTRIESEGTIVHSLATVLVGRDRYIVKRSTKTAWVPEEFLEAAKQL